MTTEPKPVPDLLPCPFKFIREHYPMTDTNFSHSQVVHLVMEAFKETRAEPVNRKMLDALKLAREMVKSIFLVAGLTASGRDDGRLARDGAVRIMDEAITAAEQQLEKEQKQ